jgi:hypothetical protein
MQAQKDSSGHMSDKKEHLYALNILIITQHIFFMILQIYPKVF